MARIRRQTTGVTLISTLLVGLSTIFILVDLHTEYLEIPRGVISYPTMGFQYVANAPTRLTKRVTRFFSDRRELIARMDQLELDVARLSAHERLMLEQRESNTELRKLLGIATAEKDYSLLAAEIVSVVPDTNRNEVIVNRGQSDGVEVGMAVLDLVGAFGQVIESLPHSSRVILITDARHSVPALIERTRDWMIVSGTGRGEDMKIDHPPITSDIEIGDVLLTSGLGGVFPSGYFIGVVAEVSPNVGGQLLDVTVEPFANLKSGRWLLIVLAKHEQ